MGSGASATQISSSGAEAHRAATSYDDSRPYCRPSKVELPADVPAGDSCPLQERLVAMGYKPDAACAALVNNADLEGAIQWLCEHPDAGIEAGIPDGLRYEYEAVLTTKSAVTLQSRHAELQTGYVDMMPTALANDDLPECSIARKDQRWPQLAAPTSSLANETSCTTRGDVNGIRESAASNDKGVVLERELASLLRRADGAHNDAKMRRDDLTAYCRRAVVGTEALEKVYLYLKDKVHNNEELAEAQVRSTIFGTYGVDEKTASHLVHKVLELILIEEDELLLKQLINRLFGGADDEMYPPDVGATHSSATDQTQAEVRPEVGDDDSVLQARLSAERDKARRNLEMRLARRKQRLKSELETRGASAEEIDAAMLEFEAMAADKLAATDRFGDARAEFDLRARLAAERDKAWRKLEARLATRDATEAIREDAVDEFEERFDSLMSAAADVSDGQCTEWFLAQRPDIIESELRKRLGKGRERARAALERRLARRPNDASQSESTLELESIFNALDEHALDVSSALVQARASLPAADTTYTSERLRAEASRLVNRLEDDNCKLERQLAVEKAKRAAELQRRLAHRRRGSSVPDMAAELAEWTEHDQSCDADELAARQVREVAFCGSVFGWSTASGETTDAAAIAALIERHNTARSRLMQHLAADAGRRRAALGSRLRGVDENEAQRAVAKLESTLQDERRQVLHTLVAEQRRSVLDMTHIQGILQGEQRPTDLRQHFEKRQASTEDEELSDALRSGLLKRATDGAAEAAALIAKQAELEESLSANRNAQRAALRQRLLAKLEAAASANEPHDVVADELEDWLTLDKDLDARDLKELGRAHSRFCGEAVGLCAADPEHVKALVQDHDAALHKLAAALTQDHARRREALMRQLQGRKQRRPADVDSALAELDEELRNDRKLRMRDHAERHRTKLLTVLADKQDRLPQQPAVANSHELRDAFLALCDDETTAANARRQRDESSVQRQREAIERRLTQRKLARAKQQTSGEAKSIESPGSLVGRIEQARRRQLMAHQLHTQRKRRIDDAA